MKHKNEIAVGKQVVVSSSHNRLKGTIVKVTKTQFTVEIEYPSGYQESVRFMISTLKEIGESSTIFQKEVLSHDGFSIFKEKDDKTGLHDWNDWAKWRKQEDEGIRRNRIIRQIDDNATTYNLRKLDIETLEQIHELMGLELEDK